MLWFLLGGILLCALPCKDTEIPATPGEPFNVTFVQFRDLTPSPDDTLNLGATIDFNFDLVYTAMPSVAEQTENISVDFGGFGPGDSFVDIAPFPDVNFRYSSASGALPVSFAVDIPDSLGLEGVDLFICFEDEDFNCITSRRTVWFVK
jgi:hypothetical protein